jgi:cytochrome c551/c552
MGIIDQLLSPPGAQQLKLGLYLIYFMLLCLLPYLGALFVTSGLSVTLRKGYPELAKSFARLGFLHPGVVVIFGLLPLLTLAFLFAQFLYGSGLPVGDYMERIVVLLAGAFGLLYLYSRTDLVAVGACGTGLLGLGIFFLVSVLDLVYHPGMWNFVQGPLPWLFSWSVLVHFGLYLVVGHLLAGIAVLFLYFRWPEKLADPESAVARPLRFWGLGLTLGGAIALPVMIVWTLALAPSTALTVTAFGAALLAVVLLFVVALQVVSMLFKGDSRHASAVLVLSLIVTGALLVSHQQLQLTANREHAIVLAMAAQKVRSAEEQEQQKLYASSEPDPALGKEIFNRLCVSCHAWDKKVVGPAYLDVLPKYLDDIEALHSFVRDPVKINPDLPAMPNQGLNEREVQSVCSYLLQELPVMQGGTNE